MDEHWVGIHSNSDMVLVIYSKWVGTKHGLSEWGFKALIPNAFYTFWNYKWTGY